MEEESGMDSKAFITVFGSKGSSGAIPLEGDFMPGHTDDQDVRTLIPISLYDCHLGHSLGSVVSICCSCFPLYRIKILSLFKKI